MFLSSFLCTGTTFAFFQISGNLLSFTLRDSVFSPYSVRMRENTDQKNSEYAHFSCSDGDCSNIILKGTVSDSLQILIIFIDILSQP